MGDKRGHAAQLTTRPVSEILKGVDARDKEREEVKQSTIKEIAEELQVSETFIYKVKKHGTPNRAFAEKLAKRTGKKTDYYLRAPRRRGRPRVELPHRFRDFVMETTKQRDKIDKCGLLRFRLQYRYIVKNVSAEFESLETFTAYVQAEDMDTAQAASLWREFKAWRIRKAANDAAFGVEMGDEFSDQDMRALLTLLSDEG